MKNKTDKILFLILFLLIACILGYVIYGEGRKSAFSEINKQTEFIHELNRQSIEKLNVEEGKTIYVIGHKSPDTDTVCSAIAYARLLNMLGYNAEARISEAINNETAFILEYAGVDVPKELLDASTENIFLVDHSEYAQAADGMIDAHIVGILDHHGIGTVTTGHQILYEGKPIGSTATIIWLDYLNYGLQIDKTTAQLLLGAVLSDTAYLTGTTSTTADKQAIEYLAKIAEINDIDDFYKQIHIKALSYDGFTDEEILFSDFKEYESSGYKYGIGLINSIDEETSKQLAAKMKKALKENGDTRDVDLIYASVGIREGDIKIDYIVPGNELSESMLKNAFPNYDEYDGTSYIFRTGLGRKTKFVPGLNDYLAAHPHE